MEMLIYAPYRKSLVTSGRTNLLFLKVKRSGPHVRVFYEDDAPTLKMKSAVRGPGILKVCLSEPF
jgi:hypothetical protein